MKPRRLKTIRRGRNEEARDSPNPRRRKVDQRKSASALLQEAERDSLF